MKKLLLRTVLVLFILFLLPLPSLYIDYKGCIEKKETKIVENLRVYEFIMAGTYGYEFEAPFICVEEKSYSTCDMWERYSKTPLKEISANKVIATGRVIKEYSFPNFFAWLLSNVIISSNLEVLEVLINNKRYWIGSPFYDHMTSGDPTYFKKIKTCPIYTIRGFTFAY